MRIFLVPGDEPETRHLVEALRGANSGPIRAAVSLALKSCGQFVLLERVG